MRAGGLPVLADAMDEGVDDLVSEVWGERMGLRRGGCGSWFGHDRSGEEEGYAAVTKR